MASLVLLKIFARKEALVNLCKILTCGSKIITYFFHAPSEIVTKCIIAPDEAS